jgi:hypothetical protein
MTKMTIESRLKALENVQPFDELSSTIAWLSIDPLMSESYGFGRIHTRNGAKTIEFNTQEDVNNFLGKTV